MKSDYSTNNIADKTIDKYLAAVYLFFMLIGLFFAYLTLDFPGFKMFNDVGTARFPLIFSIALSSLSFAGFIYTIIKPSDGVEAPKGIGKAAIGIVMIIVTATLIPIFGFYLSCFVFSCSLMRFLGSTQKMNILMVSACQTVVIYLIFQLLLKVPLPLGLLFE